MRTDYNRVGSHTVLEHLLPAGLLLLFSFALYFNSMKGEFHFDDYAYIVNAPQIRSLQESEDRSLVELSFTLNYAIHGLNYPGLQLVNIIIYGLNGIFIW
ncbi:MAG: hypothetical protein ACTFAK_09195 [Candidatus Electronema sp. VV]